MKRVSHYIEDESYESQSTAGRYHPGRVTTWTVRGKKITVPIGAGRGDDVEMFRDGDWVYVVVVRYSLGYAGLEVFEYQTGEPRGEIFLQVDYEVEEILGRNWEQKSLRWIAKVLSNYVE